MINMNVSSYAEVQEIELKKNMYGNVVADVRIFVPIWDSSTRSVDERELADKIEDAVTHMLRDNDLV